MNQRFVDWFQSRRSIRRYKPDAVSPEIVEQLLTAAAWAPSAHNRQPWRFAVITSATTKHRLATAMGESLRSDLAGDNVSIKEMNSDVARSYRRITGAPVLILACLSMKDMDTYPDEKRRQSEWLMAVQSTSMAGLNLLLAAHALGLGACWMCAPLFCVDVVRETLALPGDWQPQGLITIGHPAEVRQKSREPLSSRVVFLTTSCSSWHLCKNSCLPLVTRI